MKKKILILFCGGTIIMKENAEGALEVPTDKNEAIEILKNTEPELDKLANIDIQYIANIDSTNMNPNKWDKIIDEILNNYDDYDGFVITHGTDTMAYTSSALSIAISNLGKPIILTGSQIPAHEIDSDARRNLVNAVKVATLNISGVFIVFDERIIIGGRATKASESKLDAYTSVNNNDAGEIRINIRIRDDIPKRKNGKLKIKKGFEPNIYVYTLTPGCNPENLEFILKSKKIKGIILRAYGTGNLPYNFENFFIKAKKRKMPVVVMSQCLNGMTIMKSYEVGKRALELGVIEGYDHSLESLSVKLMWALKHYPYEKIPDIINKNFSGELRKEY